MRSAFLRKLNRFRNRNNRNIFEELRSSEEADPFTFTGVYAAKVVDVYDGDTLDINVFFRDRIYGFRIRMEGYDSAEVKPKKSDFPNEAERQRHKRKGFEDKSFLLNLVTDGSDHDEDSKEHYKVSRKLVWARFSKADKYGRILAKLYLSPEPTADMVNQGTVPDQLIGCVNEIMIENGHGYEYHGGTKKK